MFPGTKHPQPPAGTMPGVGVVGIAVEKEAAAATCRPCPVDEVFPVLVVVVTDSGETGPDESGPCGLWRNLCEGLEAA